ncbi:hypothetical protein AABB24_009579 [Solanum stoloniferum]|uniref:Uncharacterized protein n=1 Tax=Solanum stoloniferum TaxID=62892 RepID=A0ABD2UKA4_9SOLN
MMPSPLKSYPCYHPDLGKPNENSPSTMKDLSKVVFLHTHLTNFGCPKACFDGRSQNGNSRFAVGMIIKLGLSIRCPREVVAVLFEVCIKTNDAPFYGTI